MVLRSGAHHDGGREVAVFMIVRLTWHVPDRRVVKHLDRPSEVRHGYDGTKFGFNVWLPWRETG